MGNLGVFLTLPRTDRDWTSAVSVLGLEDDASAVLSRRIDIHSQTSWSGETLTEFITWLTSLRDERQESIERLVLEETKQSSQHDWHVPMIQARCIADAELAFILKMLEMADEASRRRGYLVYEGA